MKTTILAGALAGVLSHGVAYAQEQKTEHALSFNASIVSDYRYRAISQTRREPALQAGVDYVHSPTGFYVGAWGSTIKWVKDSGGATDVEIDVYGGKRGEFGTSISYDVGFLTYVYPSNGLHPSANTTEVYGQVGYGVAYLKYSHSTTNLFGFAESQNSGYLDLGANVDIGYGLVLNLHVGHQRVKNNSGSSYSDWKIGVTKDFGFATGSLAYIDTDTDAYVAPNGKNLGKSGLVFTLGRTF